MSTKARYLLLARQAHNEKLGHHPDSARYRELQAQCSKYTRLAYEEAADEIRLDS